MDKDNDLDLRKLAEKKEVFSRGDHLPFEAPSTIESGPLYVNIEEKMPEVGEDSKIPFHDKAEANRQDIARRSVDRRDFMKLFSTSTLLASAGCVRRPVEKAVPYVNQPYDMVAGVATNYATVGTGWNGAGLMVAVREGRPVKIEGNREHALAQGAASAQDQASLQALYHPERRKTPMLRYGGRLTSTEWENIYTKLADLIKSGKNKVGILTNGASGHRDDFLKLFLEKVGSSGDRLYTYENQGLMLAITEAHRLAFGVEGAPRRDLRACRYILGVGAEYFDSGVAPEYDTKSWHGANSYRDGKMGKIVQFETRMTSTGASAHDRHVIAQGDELAVMLAVLRALLSKNNLKGSANDREIAQKIVNSNENLLQAFMTKSKIDDKIFQKIADDLLTQDGVVLAGCSGACHRNATNLQLLAIVANLLVGSYDRSLHFSRGWMRSRTQSGSLKRFLDDAPDLDVVIAIDCNPAFEIPGSTGVHEVLKKIPTLVSIQSAPNETDEYAEYVLNGHHFLESWGDEQPVQGYWSTRQPVIRPTTNSRQSEDILLWILATMEVELGYRDYRDYLLERWKEVHSRLNLSVAFDKFFNTVLKRGASGRLETRPMPTLTDISGKVRPQVEKPGLKLTAFLDNRLLAGEHAHLPVLQEVGDPLTTIAWDSPVLMSPVTAKAMGIHYNDVVRLKTAAGELVAAVYPMPGLHEDTIAIPRGNGHTLDSCIASYGVGVDPLQLIPASYEEVTGHPVTTGIPVEVTKTGKKYRLCAMQKENDIGNRSDIVKSYSLEDLKKRKSVDLDEILFSESVDLYPTIPGSEEALYRWGMSVDLNKCTGCSACMVACTIENNIPQVGRDQVLLGREMHWIRLDRYFSGPVENPKVTFQPAMCQQCNHAPCEGVCPVYATTHDPEGINTQTYNRCIGTRYCANACPYKMRKFNWFTHKWNTIDADPVHRNPRALNPDVTVRTRGIMEKCTFCYQRIRRAKHEARKRGKNEKARDGSILTACQQACPADAITFGDLKDKQSRISRLRKDPRSFLMLNGDPEHRHFGIKTIPNVNYLAEVTFETTNKKKHH